MMIMVVLLGMMVGLAWFLPDDKTRESTQDSLANDDPQATVL